MQVLFGVDIEVAPGEIVALLGTNGAGKSTLLRAISGQTDPMSGAIYFDGIDITHVDPVGTFALGIVQMPGGRAVFPSLTVEEHLQLAGWSMKDDPEHVARATQEMLDIFPRLQERWSQPAGNLSGGEQQMLALSMALVAKPKLLMIDELSLGLAPSIVGLLLDVIRKINAQGTSVVIVEQSVNVALTIADRAYFLEKGEVRFSGPTAELLDRGDILRAVFLEGAGQSKAERATKSAGRNGKAKVTVKEAPRVIDRTLTPALDVRNISRSFGGISAVSDVSFTVAPNEILGLIGPNGAGKTTIFDLISGFVDVDKGQILLGGTDITALSPDVRARLGLGRSFQDAAHLRVADCGREPRGVDGATPADPRPSCRRARPSGHRRAGNGHPLHGRRAHRTDEPGGLPQQVRLRVVHGFTAHRRLGDGHRARPERADSRRAVIGYRAA